MGQPGTRALVSWASGLACAAALAAASAEVGSNAADGAALLAARSIAMPVQGMRGQALQDTFNDGRAGGAHEALDIPASRGTPVRAVDDGRLVKLFTSVRGGLTIYQFDPAGQLAYYYAHLDRYAEDVSEGMLLRRGDIIGYVGTTGNAPPDAPHLHFAVFLLDSEKRWWKGKAINPYPVLRQVP